MKIVEEMSLKDFKFWSGAKETAERLTDEQFDAVENILEDLYPDGMTDTQINDLFWFDSDTVLGWVGASDYPKWVVFKSKLGNDRVVEVCDETEEGELNHVLYKFDVQAEWHENDDVPNVHDVSGSYLEAAYHDDFDEWLWEEDCDDLQYTLWLPKDWAAAYENDDRTGFDAEEDAAFDEFLKEYENELSDHEHYFYLWDTDNIEFHDEPDFGEAGDCVTLRIYTKN